MKIVGGEAETFFFSTKKKKKIGPSGVKLRTCKRQYSKTKFMASYVLSGSNGLSINKKQTYNPNPKKIAKKSRQACPKKLQKNN